jgi:hypothetical protein
VHLHVVDLHVVNPFADEVGVRLRRRRAVGHRKPGLSALRHGYRRTSVRRLRLSIVAPVDAPVIEGLVEGQPVCPVDPARVPRRLRESACQLDPAPGLASDEAHFIRDLGEILVLAEDESDVERVPRVSTSIAIRTSTPFSSALSRVCWAWQLGHSKVSFR